MSSRLYWRILICAFALANVYAGGPTPEAPLVELRALLDTLEPGMGCVTLEGALSDLTLEAPIGLNPAAQSDEIPDFSGFNLVAHLFAERESQPIRVTVTLAFAYIPSAYTGWPTISPDVLETAEPSVGVYVDAYVPRANRRTQQRIPFRFNPSGDVYLEAVRRGDIVEYRTAFDFTVESRDGEVVRAFGAMVVLQDYETQMGVTPTPAERDAPEVERSVLPCAVES